MIAGRSRRWSSRGRGAWAGGLCGVVVVLLTTACGSSGAVATRATVVATPTAVVREAASPIVAATSTPVATPQQIALYRNISVEQAQALLPFHLLVPKSVPSSVEFTGVTFSPTPTESTATQGTTRQVYLVTLNFTPRKPEMTGLVVIEAWSPPGPGDQQPSAAIATPQGTPALSLQLGNGTPVTVPLPPGGIASTVRIQGHAVSRIVVQDQASGRRSTQYFWVQDRVVVVVQALSSADVGADLEDMIGSMMQ